MRCKRGTIKNRKTGLCEPKTAKKKPSPRSPSPRSPSPRSPSSRSPSSITMITLKFPATETGAYNKLRKEYAMGDAEEYIYPMLLAIAQFHYANIPHVAAAQERFFNKVLDDLRDHSSNNKLYGMLYNMRIKANGGVPTFAEDTTIQQIVTIFMADMEFNRAYIAPMLKNVANGKVSPIAKVAAAQNQFLHQFIELGPQYSAISNRIYPEIVR